MDGEVRLHDSLLQIKKEGKRTGVHGKDQRDNPGSRAEQGTIIQRKISHHEEVDRSNHHRERRIQKEDHQRQRRIEETYLQISRGRNS